MDSSDSSSYISEPPDLRNWFSSYVYESPVLGSIDDFKDSSCSALAELGDYRKNGEEGFLEVGVEAKKEVLLADEKGTISNGFCTHSRADEACETPDSLSQFSEPLHVRNWFSSYVYESPSLDTCFESESHPIEDERDEEENHTPNYSTRKKVVEHDPKVQTTSYNDGIIECCNSSMEDNLKADRKKNPAMLNAPMPEKNRDKDCGVEKDSEASIISRGSSPSDFNTEFQTGANRLLLNVTNASESRHQIRPRKSFLQNHPTEGKENVRTESAEDGFISTRKGKKLREEDDSSRKPIKERVRVFEKGNEEAIGTRKVLLETTNIQVPNVVESTGRWKCPRKSKPNLGPPLKQLRLEQWVRRV